MAQGRGIHWDVVGWLLLGAVLMALPTVGIFMASSTLWNIIWWVVFVGWSCVFIASSAPSAVGIFVALVLIVIYFETLPEGRFWAYALAGTQIVLVSGAYVMHCEALGHRSPERST